jgi:putative membrane protein
MKHIILKSVTTLIAFFGFQKVHAQADKAFIMKAAQANMAEIEAGKLAAEKAGTDSVKMFAQMMITDHTTALNDLGELAKKANVTLPAEPDPEHKMMKERLMKLNGSSFDAAYMKAQVTDHEKTIGLLQSQMNNATDQSVKDYAAKYLPKVKMHYQMAQDLSMKTKQQ